MKLGLVVEDRPHAAGEWIRGRVEVQEGGHSRRLTVSLLQRDRTTDYKGVVSRIDAPELHQGDLEAPASFDFNVQVPEDAVPSYSGSYGEIYWELDAKSDERGMDTHARLVIRVTPPQR
jgi:hypothetical protein